jgi:hypothetical protein
MPLCPSLSQHGRKQAGDRTIKLMAINDLFIDYLKMYLDLSEVIEMPQKKPTIFLMTINFSQTPAILRM